MTLAAPQYNIGDIVYLSESASRGFLESYRIDRVTYNTNGNVVYFMRTSLREPSEVQTIGDQFTGLENYGLPILETQLCSYYSALVLIRAALTQSLNKVNALIASTGEET